MRLQQVLTIFTVLALCSVRAAPEAVAEAKPAADPVAEAVPNAAPVAVPDPAPVATPEAVSADAGAAALAMAEAAEKTRRTKKPKSTTTMSPRDLFLMHAQQLTTKKRTVATKRAFTSKLFTTKPATTIALATATVATQVTTEALATPVISTESTTVKSKNKKTKATKGKPQVPVQSKDKACKTKLKGRKNRGQCLNKTAIATTPSTADGAPPSSGDAIAVENPGNGVGPLQLTTVALTPDRSGESFMEMAANAPVANSVVKGKSKSELVGIDSINGTKDEHHVLP